MSEFINKSHLIFIKKKNSVTLITEKNKKKDKNKKKTRFKYFYYNKIKYKKINYFYKHPKKTLSNWKSGKNKI